jgi:hypothetical protein
MNDTSIDLPSLRADLEALHDELFPLKRALRSPWPGPMGAVQRRVRGLAGQITERLILLAWTRGRRHLASAPRWLRDAGLAEDLEGYQARVAQRIAATYPLGVPTEVAS